MLRDGTTVHGPPRRWHRTEIDLQTGAVALERFYLDCIYHAIKELDGSISGIVVEGQDATEHVAMEDRLALMNGELQRRMNNTWTSDVDLPFSDIAPRSMKGLELVRRVRERWPGIGLVLMSGHILSRSIPVREAVFLPKPYRPEAVVEALRALSTRSQA